MRLVRVAIRRLCSLFQRSRANADLQREIELHLEQLVKQAMASGMGELEARILARRQFGPVEKTKEECRDVRRINLVDNLARDLRYALRIIRTKPGFSVPALLSLSLGIGANVAIFSVVNAVLIRPLPYPEPERLVGVFNSAVFSGRSQKIGLSHLACTPLTRKTHIALRNSGFGLQDPQQSTASATPKRSQTVSMTHGVLRALRVRPYLGRWFSSTDEIEGAQKTVILSYRYWQEKFGGDAGVLGRLVRIDFVPHQVIGVMPAGF